MIMNELMMNMFSGVESGGTRESAAFACRNLALLPEPYVHDRDIANAVLYLVSDEARFVTGVELPVDNGMANQPAGIPPLAAQALAQAMAAQGSK